jgi:hypothetical protein
MRGEGILREMRKYLPKRPKPERTIPRIWSPAKSPKLQRIPKPKSIKPKRKRKMCPTCGRPLPITRRPA